MTWEGKAKILEPTHLQKSYEKMLETLKTNMAN